MNQENKNSNIIAFRVDPYKKQLLQDQATKNNMKVSEYCKSVLLDNLDQNMLLDSQKKLRELIIETIILQNDMTYKYFDIPQTRSELNTHLVNHPITEVAREQVLKNIRELRNKKDNVDEQE